MKMQKTLSLFAALMLACSLFLPGKAMAASTITATVTDSSVLINGKSQQFMAYNINGNNYFKLRDLAYVLNGTTKQFDIEWDGSKNTITLIKGQVYIPSGGEMKTVADKSSKTGVVSTSPVYLNGTQLHVEAYNINGYNYFKLRDVMNEKANDVNIAWNADKNSINMDTSKSYLSYTVSNSATQATAEDVYSSCSSSVFYLKIYDKSGNLKSSGSGFFLDANGKAVTNYHVVEGASSATIQTTDGLEYDVDSILGYDANKDIAIIKINGKGFTPVTIGDSDVVKGGQKVYAIGSPYGLENSISEGIVSFPNRVLDDNMTYIQTTAPLSVGNSGGALINTAKEVIGITTLGYADGQNINFAIPINEIQSITMLSASKKL